MAEFKEAAIPGFEGLYWIDTFGRIWSYLKRRYLARRFGISQQQVCNIRKGRSWNHV